MSFTTSNEERAAYDERVELIRSGINPNTHSAPVPFDGRDRRGRNRWHVPPESLIPGTDWPMRLAYECADARRFIDDASTAIREVLDDVKFAKGICPEVPRLLSALAALNVARGLCHRDVIFPPREAVQSLSPIPAITVAGDAVAPSGAVPVPIVGHDQKGEDHG